MTKRHEYALELLRRSIYDPNYERKIQSDIETANEKEVELIITHLLNNQKDERYGFFPKISNELKQFNKLKFELEKLKDKK